MSFPLPSVILAPARLLRPRLRTVRRPFQPAGADGPYRLPHDVRDRLTAALKPFKNRDAAFTVAVFLARYHSGPQRFPSAFCADRRALAEHGDLEHLKEGKIRGALRLLEEVGYLEREESSGSKYKPTEDGLRRKPIKFTFGSAMPLASWPPMLGQLGHEVIVLANGARLSRRARLGSAWNPALLTYPKAQSEAVRTVYLGKLVKEAAFLQRPLSQTSSWKLHWIGS